MKANLYSGVDVVNAETTPGWGLRVQRQAVGTY